MSILYTNHISDSIGGCVLKERYDRIFLLDDTQTHKHCRPLLAD